VGENDALVRLARTKASEDLANPETAEFSGERVLRCADARVLVHGIVEAKAVTGPCRNWYLAVFVDNDAPECVEILQFDPTDVAHMPLIAEPADERILQ